LVTETEEGVAGPEPDVNSAEDGRDPQPILDPTHPAVKVGRTDDEVVDGQPHRYIVPPGTLS
jgi:hypothetical protein